MMKYKVFDIETFAVDGLCPPALLQKLTAKATTKTKGLDLDKLNLYLAVNPLSSVVCAISSATVSIAKDGEQHFPIIRISDVKADVLPDFLESGEELLVKDDYLRCEKMLLNMFLSELDAVSSSTVLVGYNSDNFDIPFVRYRMMVYGLDAGYARKYFRPRAYAETLDLMTTIYTRYSAQTLKATVQSLFPMYAGRDLTNGSDVRGFVLDGDWDSLRKYSALDAQMEAQLLKSYLKITM